MKITPPEMGSYAGGAVAIGTSLTLTQVGIVVGIVTALLTFGLNAWYAAKKDAREQELADLDRREREVRLAQLLAQEVKS
ncbi:HP1 family phage holin [Massilia sp. HP4]|uniref:HP1 family phage holin n=1 Tax=Massilia sp. HP4 TaxID=2562316 RepID=UPI0014853BA6|nr:HP1 family phage holin [Massilia sp. HP4]